MILLTDVNDIVFSGAHGGEIDLSGGAFSTAYEIDTSEKVRDCMNRHIAEFTVISTLATGNGGVDQILVLKTRQAGIINVACRTEIVSGFDSDALGTTHTYPSKEEDQTNLMATFVLAKELNASKPFKCWDAAGVADYRVHTVAELHQVGQDAELHKMTALVKANTLKAQIEVATTKTDVEAIVW